MSKWSILKYNGFEGEYYGEWYSDTGLAWGAACNSSIHQDSVNSVTSQKWYKNIKTEIDCINVGKNL